MKRALIIGAALLLDAAILPGASAQDPPVLHPHVLENGIRVILLPSEGAPRIGMEAVYSVGFIDEPQGMTQASHLLEHLVCMGATRTDDTTTAPGEHWRWLNEHGMANAETLGDFTHYDYEAPAAELQRLLDIERARLEGLQVTPELIAQEIPRVYAETDQVESHPAAPLFKHALMAANQSWRYGAKRALVRGGLEEIPIEGLRDFHRATYRPDRLTLVICGGFDPPQALEQVRTTLGRVRPIGQPARRPAIDWNDGPDPDQSQVQWDAKVSAVVLAFPPPPDATDRLALNLMGDLLIARLSADAEITKLTRSVICTGQTWPAGDLPVLICATLKEGVDPHAAAALLHQRARVLGAPPPSAAEMAQLSGVVGLFERFGAPAWPQAQAQGRMLQGSGLAGDHAGLVLLNTALRGTIMDRLINADLAPVRAVGRLSPHQFAAVWRRTLDGPCRIVMLEP